MTCTCGHDVFCDHAVGHPDGAGCVADGCHCEHADTGDPIADTVVGLHHADGYR